MELPTPPSHRRPDGLVRPFLLGMLFIALGLAMYVLWPFLNPIIMAGVLAALFFPVQQRLDRRLGHRPNVAALLVVLLITVVIVFPALLVTSMLTAEGLQVAASISAWLGDVDVMNLESNPRIAQALAWADRTFPYLDVSGSEIRTQLIALSKNFGQFLVSSGTGLLGNVAMLLTNFGIMIFACFYLVRDGERLVRSVKYLSPLREAQEDRILERIKGVIRSVFVGSFLTAVCQGVAGGIGLAIVGIPGFFWGTMLGFASLVPVVGTALVWIPATVYLFLVGSWKSGVFLALWSMIIVGSIDNFLRPYLMQGQARMSPFTLFLGIIGGIQVFGLAGLLYGPLVMAFAAVMLYIYQHEYQELLDYASLVGPHGEELHADEESDGA